MRYQRCGMSYAPRTACTRAATDSSDASLDRLRLEIQVWKERSLSSTALSCSSVLKMNARVRSPGSSALVTASCASRRRSRSWRHQPAQRDFELHRFVLARQLDFDRRHLLGEEPRPGAAAGDRLLGHHFLLRLGQQVWPVEPQRVQVVPKAIEPVGCDQLVGAPIVERRPFEVEEQQHRRDRRRALFGALHQSAVGRVDRVGREAQAGVVAGTADELVDLGQLVHRRSQTGSVQLGDAPGMCAGERLGARRRLPEQAVDAGVPVAANEVLEIPDDFFQREFRCHHASLPRRARRGRARILGMRLGRRPSTVGPDIRVEGHRHARGRVARHPSRPFERRNDSTFLEPIRGQHNDGRLTAGHGTRCLSRGRCRGLAAYRRGAVPGCRRRARAGHCVAGQGGARAGSDRPAA